MPEEWTRLPWQDEVWCHLRPSGPATHHALLLRGPGGIGKRPLARALAAALLCQTPAADKAACGQCDSCRWLVAGNHPDFRRVSSAAQLLDDLAEGAEAGEPGGSAAERKASQQITIEQVRALSSFLALTTHRGGARVLLVEPAEAMNPAASNALLKTLEEPGPGTRFILVSDQPRRLAPTILSRCLCVNLVPPAPAMAMAWLIEKGIDTPQALLAQAAGRPLHALELANPEQRQARQQFLGALAAPGFDPHTLAEKAHRDTLAQWTEWLQIWCHDLLLIKQGVSPRFHADQAAALKQLAARADAGRLLDWELRLRHARYEVRQPVNARLFCDDLLMAYRALFS